MSYLPFILPFHLGSPSLASSHVYSWEPELHSVFKVGVNCEFMQCHNDIFYFVLKFLTIPNSLNDFWSRLSCKLIFSQNFLLLSQSVDLVEQEAISHESPSGHEFTFFFCSVCHFTYFTILPELFAFVRTFFSLLPSLSRFPSTLSYNLYPTLLPRLTS